jgi:uncharacterized SAM-binding protein YcdF (DUF218 family)
LLKKRWLIAILAVVCVVIAVFGGLAASIYAYAGNSEAIQADAAIVLGAAAWGEQPSPVFRERINHAIELYQSERVRKIIFTGGQGESDEPAEAMVARQYALERGVAEADILTETQSRTTEQNLRYARQVAAEHHLTRFLVVSDPLHMRRAMLLAQDLGMDAHPSPPPTSRYQSTRSQVEFLARETYYYFTYLVRRPFIARFLTGVASCNLPLPMVE